MSTPIEELRAQRTLIQKHLEWLDEQIQQAEKNYLASSPLVDATKKTSAAPDSADSKDQKPEEEIARSHFIEQNHSLIESDFTQSSSTSDIKRAQIWCFTIFAVATLIFLFILFGLPYLLS